MSYLPYVIAAYAVFFGVLATDWLAGHLAIRRALRQIRQPAETRRQRTRPQPSAELER